MLPVFATVEIVEIKKANHSLTDEEFTRLRGYYDAMEAFLAENAEFRKEFSGTHMTLVCDGLVLSRNIELAYAKLQGDEVLDRKTWEEILAVAKRRYEEFIELREALRQQS